MNRKGVAVITVVSIMGIGLLMAIAFIAGMYYENISARNFLNSIKAEFAARSVANYALKLLKEDEDKAFDGVDDNWITELAGEDVAVEDGYAASRWIWLDDKIRAAALVVDESGKAPLMSPWLRHENVVESLKAQYTLTDAALEMPQEILSYVKGPDGAFGGKGIDDNLDAYFIESNGLDDNGNGLVDELGEGVDDAFEYDPELPFGDDRDLFAFEQVQQIAGLSKADMRVLDRYFTTITVSSELGPGNLPKGNINALDVLSLYSLFLNAGVEEPWKKAVCVKDFLDRDCRRSQIFFSQETREFSPSDTAPNWVLDKGVLINKTPDDQWGTWKFNGLQKGRYHMYIYGQSGAYIGDVRAGGVEKQDVYSGDSITAGTNGLYVGDDGSLTVSVRLRPDAPSDTSVVGGMMLVPADIKGGQSVVNGIEAVRIWAVYSNPSIELNIGQAEIIQNGTWALQGSSLISNSTYESSKDEARIRFSGLRNGKYYVQVFGKGAGATIGDVSAGSGFTQGLLNGEFLSYAANVYNGTLELRLRNILPDGQEASLSRVVLTQQPDCEFIAIANLSNKDIDLGGWLVSVVGKDTSNGFIPQGTTIKGGSFLVLAVDHLDTAKGLSNTGLAFKYVKDTDPAFVAELDVPLTAKPGLDFLPSSGVLQLKDGDGFIVDAVDLPDLAPFEVGYRDPLSTIDENMNGEFDNWQAQLIDDFPLEFSPSQEVSFINGPAYSIIELMGCPDGSGGTLNEDDLARIWSQASVVDITLPLLKARTYGWSDQPWGFESSTKDEVIELLWSDPTRLVGADYHLFLEMDPSNSVAVSLYEDGNFGPFMPAVWADNSGIVDLGIIRITEGKIGLRIKNSSFDGSARLYGIHLYPAYRVKGRMNINTAQRESLYALPFPKEVCDAIYNGRPYSSSGMGIGKLLKLGIDANLLRGIERYVSVNSSVYKIIGLGQVVKKGKSLGEKKVWLRVERK